MTSVPLGSASLVKWSFARSRMRIHFPVQKDLFGVELHAGRRIPPLGLPPAGLELAASAPDEDVKLWCGAIAVREWSLWKPLRTAFPGRTLQRQVWRPRRHNPDLACRRRVWI